MLCEDVAHWMQYAEKDYAVAKHLLEKFRPIQCEIICYHCQQTAEKAIKAVYIGLDLPGGIPKKHDLSFLLNQIKNYVNVSDDLLDQADELTPYGVTVRYPSEIYVDEKNTTDAVKCATEILLWAKQCISKIEKTAENQ